jgi:hypothetical protein
MSYYGSENLLGGRSQYGNVAGMLILCSTSPRLPGDPAHAQTFDFPVCYRVVEDLSIKDLIALDRSRLDRMIEAAKFLEALSVRFIATSCGLFAPFQREIAEQLTVPFLSSSLHAVSFLRTLLPRDSKIAVFTAHSGLLTEEHIRGTGFSLDEVVIHGMESYPEFARVVLEGGRGIDVDKLRQDVRVAAEALRGRGERIGAVVLECPNLITFRSDIQAVLRVPVYDIVNLVGFLAQGCALTPYSSPYI